MSEFSELFSELPEEIQASLRDLGWTQPTPVQAKAIPLMRTGIDLIVQAHTGSGKTGAFGIPLIESVDLEDDSPQALVMLPTRELANQVATDIGALARYRKVRVLPVYGGVGYAEQIEALERGVHIVVGTPGRILDHLSHGRMNLGAVRVLVLDEADEMLSLGFWPDMKEVASYLPKQRQSHLFSATIPEKVRSLSRFFLREPEFIALGDGHLGPQQIEHYYYVCAANEKEALLARILEYEDPESAIVFCNTRADVRFISGYLRKRGFNADQISGDLQQSAREKALRRIKSGELRYLVATDVAARGIDISDLSHVISYATADSPEVYVHRTGRTGRAGKSGIAISLVSGLDIGNFKHMQNVNQIEIMERKAPTQRDMLHRIQERLQVKVEQEMRGRPKDEVQLELERFLPIIESMVQTPEGQHGLAGICAAYMSEHRPQTTVEEVEIAAASSAEARGNARRGRSGPRREGGETSGRSRRPRSKGRRRR